MGCCIVNMLNWLEMQNAFHKQQLTLTIHSAPSSPAKNSPGDAGDRTRGLSHAKRTLYRWATSPCTTMGPFNTQSNMLHTSQTCSMPFHLPDQDRGHVYKYFQASHYQQSCLHQPSSAHVTTLGTGSNCTTHADTIARQYTFCPFDLH